MSQEHEVENASGESAYHNGHVMGVLGYWAYGCSNWEVRWWQWHLVTYLCRNSYFLIFYESGSQKLGVR